MKRVIVRMGQEPIARDPNAKAMWGRCRSATFDDRRKRNPKHKAQEEWEYE